MRTGPESAFRAIVCAIRGVTTAFAAVALSLAPAALAQTPTRPASGTPSLAEVQAIFHLSAVQPRDRSRSCAKGAKRSKVALAGSTATGNLARKAVVACEQPPRAQPIPLSTLQHAEAVLRALIG
jgi:hypothetical protein